MGGKKRKHPDVEDLLNRAWCYYCERDFEDLKLLISHQKAKHFKCDRCGRRLNTAGGLSVHMSQVHKESLSSVENALPNRQGLDVEIFGMEGIPEDIAQQHNQRIIQNFYQAQAERHAATGNPPPGQSDKQPAKKIKAESMDEIKKRLAEHRARMAGARGGANGGSATQTPPQGLPDANSPAQGASPGAFNSPFHPPGGAQYPGYSNQPQYPHAYPPSNLPTRPGSNVPAASGLPARPGQTGWPANAAAAEDLASNAVPQQGDDIDQLIRMAEAGIKPPKRSDTAAAAEEAVPEKKSKKDKDKNVQMVYEDELSPEERMAMMPRYVLTPEITAA
ncbi:putative c2h2 type zinc finger containing protein [Rosellinia necatrix]|uniref:Putative c2h2 type zinc finger containing protein n=1 Tax=Rosellinia necatrix TaxID=77044 RepID=A0A1W2TBW8_ROSNE|nr:putative c2h2 type zinc finger containing protein [Rosellinia necatrix]